MPEGLVVAAGLVLRRPVASGWQWLLLCASKHGEWGFPKGHLDPGETPWTAALRECVEETGIATVSAAGESLELHYRLPGGRAKVVHYFPAVTRTTAVQLSDEHSDHRWCNPSDVLHLLPHANLRAMFVASRALIAAA